MKFIQVALAVVLAIASVEVAAHPKPEAIAEAKAFCNSPNQLCHNVKRVTESLAEPVANQKRDPKRHGRPWCWLPGEPCHKAKRDAPSIAQVKGNPWCWIPGQACMKAKRQLEEPEAAFEKL